MKADVQRRLISHKQAFLVSIKFKLTGDFPGGPVVKTQLFYCMGATPGQTLHEEWPIKKKQKTKTCIHLS